MSIRYGQKIAPLISRKSGFYKKNRFDRLSIKRPSDVSTPNTNTWIRPADWLTMPAITPSEQKIALLMPVFPQGSNFLAFTIMGAYAVDWGDGIVDNVDGGIKAQHAYDYASLTSITTSDGYKMAIVTITPQAGHNLVSVNFNVAYESAGSTFPVSSPILEITLSCPNLMSLSLGAASAASVYCKSLVHFSGVNMGLLNNYNYLFSRLSALKHVSNLYTITAVTNMSGMFANCSALVSVPLFDTAAVTNMSNMFNNCFSLISVPLFDTGAVTTMSYMFINCASLASVPLFDTAAVVNMAGVFASCASLVSVPLFDTGAVIDMSSIFASCASLVSVPLFDTAAVVYMSGMFSGCVSLISVPLFNTGRVTNMSGMFNNCFSLVSVPLFNTGAVLDMSSMFATCRSLVSVPLFNTRVVGTMSGMFASCASLVSVPLFVDTGALTNMSGMFSGCVSLVSVPLFYTGGVTNMSGMFSGCVSLVSVPLFNTVVVISMSTMFSGCSSLVSVPSFVDTGRVTNMSNMFENCASLVSVPLFDTWVVTVMSNMFFGCRSLVSVPSFDTAAVMGMASMFSGCGALVSVPLFDTGAVTNMSSMFASCASLVSVPSFVDTGRVTNMSNMFSACSSLVSVPLFNTAAVTNMSTVFSGCPSLTRGTLNGTRFSVSYSGCKLSKEELESVFTNLGTIGAAGQTLTISGNWGAPTTIGLTGSNAANSTTITMANTTGLAIGMQVTGGGSPLTASRSAFFASGNIIQIFSHGLSSGDEVSFNSSTVGVVANRIYYVINTQTDNFQLASTPGGNAITFTSSGTSTAIKYRTQIVSITLNASITVSRPMAAAASGASYTFRQLKTGTALLKGWTVTG